MSITLHIYTPQTTYPPQKADKVVLPVKEGNLTIIKDRAPRSQVLSSGTLSLLDENNQAFKSWQIEGGLAEIAEDICTIAVENIKEI